MGEQETTEAERARAACGCSENAQGGCPQPSAACLARVQQSAPCIEVQIAEYAERLGRISAINVASRYGTGKRQAYEWLRAAEAMGLIQRCPGAFLMWRKPA